MYRNLKATVQVVFFLTLSAGFLMFSAWLLSTPLQPTTQSDNHSPFSLNFDGQSDVVVSVERTLANSNASLSISKQSEKASAPANEFVDFTILITNTDVTTISDIEFREFPDEALSIIQTEFSDNVEATALGGSETNAWDLDNLGGGETAVITVSTQLLENSECDIKAQNEARVIAPGVSEITDQAEVLIEIQDCVYFPVLRKDPTPTPTPTPTPLYFHDFNGDEDWDTGESNDNRCDSEYGDNGYIIEVDGEIDNNSDEVDGCFRPAPDEAEYTYGLFEVDVRQASGGERFVYGIYINGDGGEEQYLFRIAPDDDCGWDLIRNEDDENPEEKREGGCDAAINRNDATNRMAIRHTSDGRVTVYVNGTELGTYVDNDQLNDGKGTGLYVKSDGDEDNRIRFDNFRVKGPDAPLTP